MTRFLIIVAVVGVLTGCVNESPTSSMMGEKDLETYTSTVFESDEFLEHAAAFQSIEASEAEDLSVIRQMEDGSTATFNDEPFVFFVIGDSELGMRGNTYPQLLNWIEHINNMDSYDIEFASGEFDDGESRKITKPELILLAGDINGDRSFGFSLPGTENAITNQETYQLFNQLDEDILFLPGNGNHDWDPYQWGGEGYGHNFGGLLSNLGTAKFVRTGYMQSLNSTDEISGQSFNYDRNVSWFKPTTSAEFNYSFVYRGVRFSQLNQFLYQPAAMVSFESIFGTGPAWYFQTRSENWFEGVCSQSALDQTPHVVVQHFPIYTGDGWWNDDLGSSPDELRKRFLDVFQTSYEPVMFTGHNHNYRTTNVQPYDVTDHTSGYFANGYLMAVKASAAKGIYAVSYVSLDALTSTDPSEYATSYTVPQ